MSVEDVSGCIRKDFLGLWEVAAESIRPLVADLLLLVATRSGC